MTKTDSEIIELLETCGEIANCKKCSFYNAEKNNCLIKLNTYALDLINRQQAEIERLTQENNALNGNTEKYIEDCEKRSRQIAEGYRKEIKFEAVREFAGKLKKKTYPFPCAIGVENAVTLRAIDELVEEMGCNDG